MAAVSKPLWGEGQFLRPQHFQRQDAYHEWRLGEMAGSLHPFAWGLLSLEVDESALGHNELRITGLKAVMRDGDIIDAPGADDLPAAVSLASAALGADEVVWHIALPNLRSRGGNMASSSEVGANSGQRYAQHTQQQHDWFTEADVADITALRRQLKLVPSTESAENYITLPILRLRRQGAGGFQLDKRYVPPATRLQAAPELMEILRRLLNALQAKVDALQGVKRESAPHVVDLRPADQASMWLLHSASQGYAALSHLFHHPGLHPERLYHEFLRLAGGLLAFSRRHKLADLMPYDHEAPEACFVKMEDILRDLLDTVISTKDFSITLTEVEPSFHNGRLDSERITPKTRLVLAVRSGLPLVELVKHLPERIKLGSPTDVKKIAHFATPGVRVSHTPQVPSGLPGNPDVAYFVVMPQGSLFERMMQSQAISIYLPTSGPNGVRDASMELFALND